MNARADRRASTTPLRSGSIGALASGAAPCLLVRLRLLLVLLVVLVILSAATLSIVVLTASLRMRRNPSSGNNSNISFVSSSPRQLLDDGHQSEVDIGSSSSSSSSGHHATAHDPLFPLTTLDLCGLAASVLALALAAGGGIGGGGMLVPIYVLVLKFHPKHAIPLSNVTVFGGAVANTLLNIRKRHPDPMVDRPLINWDLILGMEPLTIGGALLGSNLNRLLPEGMIVIMLVALLSFAACGTLRKARELYEKETRQRQQRQRLRQQRWSGMEEDDVLRSNAAGNSTIIELTDLPSFRSSINDDGAETCPADSKFAGGRQPSKLHSFRRRSSAVEEEDGGPSEFARAPQKKPPLLRRAQSDVTKPLVRRAQSDVVTPSSSFVGEQRRPHTNGATNGAAANAGLLRRQSQLRRSPGTLGRSLSLSIAEDNEEEEESEAEEETEWLISTISDGDDLGRSRAQEPKETTFSDEPRRRHVRADVPSLQDMLEEERTTPFRNVAVVSSLFLIVLVINILKGGGAFESPLHIECNSIPFWALEGLMLVCVIAFSLYARSYLMERTRLKDQLGYRYVEGDVRWDGRATLVYSWACSLAGVFAGLFGIGGGLIKAPLMLAMEVRPDVASATSACMILFTSFTATTSFAVFGLLVFDYALLCLVIGFLSTLLGQTLMSYLLGRFQRHSYIAFCIGICVLISAVFMAAESVIAIKNTGARSSSGLCTAHLESQHYYQRSFV